MRSKIAGSPPISGSCAATPALATTTSRPPRRSTAPSTTSCTCTRSVTSHSHHGAPPHCAATRSSSSGSRPASATRAPRSCSRRAVPAPIPRAAPVIRTRRPSRGIGSVLLISYSDRRGSLREQATGRVDASTPPTLGTWASAVCTRPGHATRTPLRPEAAIPKTPPAGAALLNSAGGRGLSSRRSPEAGAARGAGGGRCRCAADGATRGGRPVRGARR